MYKNVKPLFFICETPLHAGSGSDLGIVDLPIQRERHTSFPKIESSSLKGAIRQAFEQINLSDDIVKKEHQINIHKVFGFDDQSIDVSGVKESFGENKQFAGALGITDARILLYPVKSLYGVFAWVTCPRVIKKFISDLQLSDIPLGFTSGGIENKVPHECSDLFRSDSDKKLYLEEYVFNSINKDEENGNLSKLGKWLSTNIFDKYDSYWKEKVAKDIVVLEDVDFRDFVTLTTEVITRTKIDNATGTVSDGALFTEEYLPAESVMYSLVMFAEEFSKDGNRLKAVKTNESDSSPNVLDFFSNGLVSMNNVLQIGGNVTLGKGIVRTKLLTEPVKSEENDKV